MPMDKELLRCTDSKWIHETRRLCNKCGHSMNFYTTIPYLECTHCRNLVFRDKKCEFDYKVRRRLSKCLKKN